VVTRTVVEARRQLERYIARHPAFRTALEPLPLLDEPPEAARRMAAAAELTGLGPMAAVAGTLAQLGAEAALADGCAEAIVENGGDIFLVAVRPVTIALHAGAALGSRLAFRIDPPQTPLALCSSSGTMGHSLSLGRCDLATVASRDASLADAAATLVGNLVRRERDLTPALERVGAIPGVDGILAVTGGRIGLWGQLPPLVRNEDETTGSKITRDLHAR
jgi:ApbE superfamily uncharacterized protein (UPF0280 family)